MNTTTELPQINEVEETADQEGEFTLSWSDLDLVGGGQVIAVFS